VSVLDVWRFCPRCREELELEGGKAMCPWCGFVSYAHSAPTASALVTDASGRLLLARRAREPDRGLWDLPGGFLEEGEHPLDGLRRELLEETGLEVEPADFVCATIDRYGSEPGAQRTLNLTWTARVLGGTLSAADDVAELAWFRADELPGEDELAFETVADVLAAWLRRQQHA
jgi:ADP-ribose pyrophosphatase YjhB (NUDIX family)